MHGPPGAADFPRHLLLDCPAVREVAGVASESALDFFKVQLPAWDAAFAALVILGRSLSAGS